MNALGLIEQQLRNMKSRPGFVSELDQSGGCAPKGAAIYGLLDEAVQSIFEASTISQEPSRGPAAERKRVAVAA